MNDPHTVYSMLIGEKIRNAIRAQGWSQRALAIETGVPQQTIGRFLNGADLKLSTLELIAPAIGLLIRIAAKAR